MFRICRASRVGLIDLYGNKFTQQHFVEGIIFCKRRACHLWFSRHHGGILTSSLWQRYSIVVLFLEACPRLDMLGIYLGRASCLESSPELCMHGGGGHPLQGKKGYQIPSSVGKAYGVGGHSGELRMDGIPVTFCERLIVVIDKDTKSLVGRKIVVDISNLAYVVVASYLTSDSNGKQGARLYVCPVPLKMTKCSLWLVCCSYQVAFRVVVLSDLN